MYNWEPNFILCAVISSYKILFLSLVITIKQMQSEHKYIHTHIYNLMFFRILEFASSSFPEFDQALKIVLTFIIENPSYIQTRTLLTLILTKHDRETYIALQ